MEKGSLNIIASSLLLFLHVLSQINYLNSKTKKESEVALGMCYVVRVYNYTQLRIWGSWKEELSTCSSDCRVPGAGLKV